MKAIFKFDMETVEDYERFKCHSQAIDMYDALWDITQDLRNKSKHGEYDEKEFKLLDSIMEMIWDKLEYHNVNLDIFS